jgi:circadian clock protein KaiC
MSTTGQPPDVATAAVSQPGHPTGVPNLDRILGGGVPRGSLVLVMGPPGSGKTTLATQMAFAAARAGRRALIFTALSEPTNKLVDHLRTFSFCDEDLLGDAVQVLSMAPFLTDGLTRSAESMLALAREARADLVVLDGFRGLQADAEAGAARAFLYSVGTALSVPGTTTIITTEAPPRDATLFPEATTADVLLGLHYTLDGMRQHRALEALKVRGAAPLPGAHSLILTSAGMAIYPRLEARVRAEAARAEEEPGMEGRAAFGLPALDRLLNGGLTRETSTLVLGSLGTGKTLLGLHFALSGISEGEPVVYLGFRETRGQLLRRAEAFALAESLRGALAPGGGLTLWRLDPIDLDPDIIADGLLAALDTTGARRLVVDSITELERAISSSADPRRLDDYLAALLTALRARGVTALFVKESRTLVSSHLESTADAPSILAENVLLLQQVTYHDRLVRVLSVPKMRFSAHDVALREFRIAAPAGLRVLTLAESGGEALTGIARQQGAPLGNTEEAAPPVEGVP